MTKAAISHLIRCMAVEWGAHNIAVNAVAPTFIATPGTDDDFAPTRSSGLRRCIALESRWDVAGAANDAAAEALDDIGVKIVLALGAAEKRGRMKKCHIIRKIGWRRMTSEDRAAAVLFEQLCLALALWPVGLVEA